jgi:uncharacterized ion transporter superfamily protein YfcC
MPRIKTTRTVRFALWALRIYLLILLVLIGIKFVRVFASSHKADNATLRPSAKATATTNQATVETKP